ncbi:IS66 family transposase [Stigmatella sp. ncwal1]|uniref:IS66 family transposase n=1 Tax=Stigmatella ashevillensis TaxID=2995309 RepID=A0ABT5DE04_9BACT|nr:IS66 family transposase [Stigmatella ashevillena]MDC0710548.1 IS66 family transposase [Stigmatella ashevillena]MDC0711018.1 IS66 family transposase [Stigmatella ashevillena]MDC0714227.1 IS66 family transposase [Stigmatella ashevillena]
MPRELPLDHFCPWREEAEELRERLTTLEAKMASLERHVFGKKAERLPTVRQQLQAERTDAEAAAQAQAALQKRRERATLKMEQALTREVRHAVPEEQRQCPTCGSQELKPLGKGRISMLYEYIPPRFERQVHVQETLACACGKGVVTAPVPPKVVDRGEYGPRFIAHVVASKCADSLPLHRLAQRVERGGVPMSRSTLTDLFHRAAEGVAPLAARLLLRISQSAVVWADETPLRVLEVKKTHLGYLWTFLTQNEQGQWLIGYRFSMSRSGKTPQQVLNGTLGALVVDAYTGYNPVTLPGGRVRVGCWSHARRKFFDALSTAPEAQQALDFILSLYRVEHEAVQTGVVRMLTHRALRQHKSRPVLQSLHAWLTAQLPLHPPKSPMGQALSYTLHQWQPLCRFVDDERLPLDNNRSEGALRKVALGRKNFLFVGHPSAGENLAGLYALVATCEANGINPELYLADVLLRVQTHPNSRIDELLPHLWQPLSAAAAA